MHRPNILIGPFDFFGQFVQDLDLPFIKTFALGAVSKEITQIKAMSELSSAQADVVYNMETDFFSSILERLPSGWKPDFIVYWEPIYQAVLPGLEHCPLPVALIPADFYVSGAFTEYYLPLFDHILVDEGLKTYIPSETSTTYWPSFYYDESLFVHQHKKERPIDICFIGNMNHDIHKARGFLLEQIAPLSSKYRVHFGSGVFGKDYVDLLNQSKIVVNFSVRGEMNLRGFEAPACGALLFMEEDNLEVRNFFTDRESCILYNAENITALLEYYLGHMDECQEIASKGHQIAQRYSYQKMIPHMLEKLIDQFIENKLHKQTTKFSDVQILWAQAYQLINTHTPGAYKRGLDLLSGYLKQHPNTPEISHLYATSLYYESCPETYLHASFEILKDLVERHPNNLIIHFNFGLLAYKKNQYAQAKTHFETVLKIATYQPMFLPIIEDFGFFKIQWERSYFINLRETNTDALVTLIHGQALKRLAEIALLTQTPSDALEHYKQVFKLLPHWGEMALTLAQFYFKKAQYQQVITVCEQAIEKSPLSFDIWSLLAKSYFMNCQWEHLKIFAQSKLQVIAAFDNEGQFCKQELESLLEMAAFAYQYDKDQTLSKENLYSLFLSVNTNELRFYLQHLLRVLNIEPPPFVSAHLVYDWHPETPEPAPAPYPGSANHQITLTVTPKNRNYHGVFSPEVFPYMFPETEKKQPPNTLVKNRVLLFLEDWTLPNATILESLFQYMSDQEQAELWIWSPTDEPGEAFLSALESQIPKTLEDQITLLTGKQTASEMAVIFAKALCLVGEPFAQIDWYLWWASQLFVPVVFTRSPQPLFGVQTKCFLPLEQHTMADILKHQPTEKTAHHILFESKKTALKQFQFTWKHICKSHFLP